MRSTDTNPALAPKQGRKKTEVAKHQRLGRSGEAMAAHYLRKSGYRLCVRNYRCPYGEIDLVARNREDVVFVEVKTRREPQFHPSLSITPRKQQRLRNAGQYYWETENNELLQPRFDVITISLHGGEAHLEHFPDAF